MRIVVCKRGKIASFLIISSFRFNFRDALSNIWIKINLSVLSSILGILLASKTLWVTLSTDSHARCWWWQTTAHTTDDTTTKNKTPCACTSTNTTHDNTHPKHKLALNETRVRWEHNKAAYAIASCSRSNPHWFFFHSILLCCVHLYECVWFAVVLQCCSRARCLYIIQNILYIYSSTRAYYKSSARFLSSLGALTLTHFSDRTTSHREIEPSLFSLFAGFVV